MRRHLTALGLLTLVLTALSLAVTKPQAADGANAVAGRAGAFASVDRAFQAQLVGKVNALRTSHRLARLRISPGLQRAAEQHCREMAKAGSFTHESRDGSAFEQRVLRSYPVAGYRSWAIGENLVWGTSALDAPSALERWLKSPLHRDNLLSGVWREIGLTALRVPTAGGVFGGEDVILVTADFGVRR